MTKRAVLGDSCPSVPFNISTLCPASLGSVLMWGCGNGYDRSSWLVNLVMCLDRCDRELCIGVAPCKQITLTAMPFLLVYFESRVLVVDLPGLFWDMWGAVCVYLYALVSFGRDEGTRRITKVFLCSEISQKESRHYDVVEWPQVGRALNLAAQQIRCREAIDRHWKCRVKLTL